MELKPGYKMTEVGVIPEDWTLSKLGNLLDFSNGFNADQTSYGHGLPFISTLDVLRNSHIIYINIIGKVYINQNLNSYIVKKGDILFTRTSETQDEIGISSVYTDNIPVIFGGFIIKGHQKRNIFDVIYAGYAFRSPVVRRQIISLGQGGIHVNIGQKELEKITVPIPSLHEQQAIAAALSDVDELLSSLDRLIAKKKDIRLATMQELLTGKKRLPGFNEPWSEKNISSIAKIVGGGTPSTAISSYWNGGIPWFTPAEINENVKYVSTSNRTISQEGLNHSSAKLLPIGTILFTTRASIGLKSILLNSATTNQGFQNIIVNKEFDNQFIYYLLTIFKNKIIKESSGSTFLEISPKKLGKIVLYLPDNIKEQQAIASVLSDMDAEIEALEARRDKVRNIKTGMMQELLTGKTRLISAGETA